MFFFFFDMDNKDKVKVFLDSLLKTNRTYDYFVCWNNVYLQEFDIELCSINSLIKKWEYIYRNEPSKCNSLSYKVTTK